MNSNSKGGRQSQLSEYENDFLSLSLTVGMVGVLILRRLKFLSRLSAGVYSCTTSEADLAKHCGKSVATVKRYLNRLKTCNLIEVHNRGQGLGGKWLPNGYTLLPLSLHFMRQFGTIPEKPWLTEKTQILESSLREKEKTWRQPVSHGQMSEEEGPEEEVVKVIGGVTYTFLATPRRKTIRPQHEVGTYGTGHGCSYPVRPSFPLPTGS